MQTRQPRLVCVVESPLYPNCPPVQHPAAMSTDFMFKFSQFRSHNVSNEFGTYQRGGIYGQKGDHPQIEGSLRISLAGMTTSGNNLAIHIASLAWKATGYRSR